MNNYPMASSQGHKMRRKQKRVLLDALLRIRSGEFNPRYGICGNVEDYTGKFGIPFVVVFDYMVDKWENWEHFSGRAAFPVMASPDSYISYKWDKHTKGGALRWELLDFLIEKVSNDVEAGGDDEQSKE